MTLCEGLELVDGIRWYRVETHYLIGYVGIDREDRFIFGTAPWLDMFRAWTFDNLIDTLSLGPKCKVRRIKAEDVDHVHENCKSCHGEWPCGELSTPKHPCRERLCPLCC